jgi:hypothetical protein
LIICNYEMVTENHNCGWRVASSYDKMAELPGS